MLGRLSAGILALVSIICLGLSPSPASADDTGTYRISDYIVTLEPQSNGQVRLTMEQEWEVLSGSIPWVTVGLPNNNYSIVDYGGDVRTAAAANSGDWSGVRLDLDKGYGPGDRFNVQFTVMQRNLIERLPDEGIWRIDYTPGWYDRAAIGHLEIRLVSPVDYQSYTQLSPSPSVSGNTLTWERSNLAAGQRFNIRTESMDGTFLDENAEVVTSGGFNYGIVIGVLVVVAILLLLLWVARKARRDQEARRVQAIELEMAENEAKKAEIEKGFEKYVEEKGLEPDDEGRYFDKKRGDYVTPAIWAALISHQFYRPYVNPGTNRGGTGNSCVSCACVSCACACACACAGGGAAGCSRKTVHECAKCREDESKARDTHTPIVP